MSDTLDIGAVGERLRRVTVEVRSGRQGSGSGVLWPRTSASALVVTNAHVATSNEVLIKTWDGREFRGTVVERDVRRDLARVEFAGAGLPSAEVGDSSRLRSGEWVVAVGNPMGFVGALSTGVVHGVGGVRGIGKGPWIQAAVRLAPGNSGGPLADAAGRVVGINTMVTSINMRRGHSGLGLAIPSAQVAEFLSSGSRPALGLSIRPVWIDGAAGRQHALLVLEVEPGSPAATASLLPGDLLIGTLQAGDWRTFDDLSEALDTAAGAITLRFLRGDRTHVRQVTVPLPGRRAA